MQRFIGMALAAGFALGPAVAAAQAPGPQDDRSQGSLLLATLVGANSPTLSAAQKSVLSLYRAGKPDAKAGKLIVKADQISCTAGNQAETTFACDLKFGAAAVHLTARPASQIFAALQMIGAWSPAPFAPYSASVSAVTCTLDAAVIAGGNDGGADCAYTPALAAAAGDAPTPPSPLKVDNDASLLVAALVGGNSPTLSAADKAALTHYLAGQPASDAAAPKFTVSAAKVLCTSSNRSEITWSCDLKFAAKTVHLTAAPAADLYAALMLAGLTGQAAMGTDEVGAAPFTCALDPAALAAGAGGAACTLTEAEF